MVAGQRGMDGAPHHERQRRVAALGNGSAREPSRRLAVVHLPGRPFHQVALLKAPGGKGVGGRIAGVDLHDPFKQPHRRVIVGRGLGKGQGQCPQGQVIDVEGRIRFAPRPLDLREAEHRTGRPDHGFGNLVLKIERIFERAVKPLGPQMLAALGLDQLAADADAAAGLAQAALDDVADAKLAPELLRNPHPCPCR